MLFPDHPRLSFVDLETTGGSVETDRITEIGVVEVDADGEREWSCLVDPGRPIPPFIESLTGISNAMVQGEPAFESIAAAVAERLKGRLFIAHNARFDHGFLKRAFERVGIAFKPDVLCTVRLSRRLFSGYSRHNLDSLIERHRLVVTERHRALGDARLLVQFWRDALQRVSRDEFAAALERIVARPTLPSLLPAGDAERLVRDLPTTAGVYRFFGDNDLPLYVGKAVNLRRRVWSHFTADHRSSKTLDMCAQIRRVDWIDCAGELGALLREADLVKRATPVYNVQLRKRSKPCAWRVVRHRADSSVRLKLCGFDDLFFGVEPDLYGVFASRADATRALRAICDEQQCCPALLGLEKREPGRSCFAHQVHRCRGACIGAEPLADHADRLEAGLERLRLASWPFDGPVLMPEGRGARREYHVLDAWSYLGSVRERSEARRIAATQAREFDADTYRILRDGLSRLRDTAEPVLAA
ncbi:hypothetical protein BH09PSE6_BH09PSE6_10090 [soil metagenome]